MSAKSTSARGGETSEQSIVLLHGWPQNSRMWEPLVPELELAFRVLTPDLWDLERRGSGTSYSKHRLAAGVLELLDRQGIEDATIVGHDWGGWIAWLLALEHPERVTRFVSLDIPPPWGSGTSLSRVPVQLVLGSYQMLLASPILGRRFSGSERALRSFMRLGAGPEGFDEERLEDYARSNAEGEGPDASVALYRTFLTRELPAVIRGTYTRTDLEVPGLVLMGQESGILKMTGRPKEQPNLRVRVIPGAGHFLVDEVPDRVMGHMRPFLVMDHHR